MKYTEHDLDLAIFQVVPHYFTDEGDEMLEYCPTVNGGSRPLALRDCGHVLWYGEKTVDERTEAILRQAWKDLKEKCHFDFAPESEE